LLITENKKKEMLEKANNLAVYKSQRISYEHYRKVLKARLMKKAMANGVTAVQAQEREAYASIDYEQIINAIQVAVEQETKLWWELHMFENEIQVWRTQQANERNVL
jgi:predicted nucleotidyltransferase